MRDTLFDLLRLDGVSSSEEAVATYMTNQFRKYSDDVTTDPLGNVICRMGSEIDENPIVVFAHMDEIGFIIRKIEDNGFIRFERIGGVNRTVIQGSFVTVHGKKEIKGVIGTQSHHFMSADKKSHISDVAEMYIDIGYHSLQEVLDVGVNVGDFISFSSEIVSLGHYLTSKAMDNRVGCASLLKIQENISKASVSRTVYLVAAVMEEFSIRGILPVIRKVKPSISIGIDITPACDTPDLDYNRVSLGGGPALTCMNFHGRGTLAGVLPNKKVFAELEQICKRNDIHYQREVAPGVITENAFILFENDGVKVANVSIPCRYTHTQIETVCLQDIEDTVELLSAYLLNCKQGD